MEMNTSSNKTPTTFIPFHTNYDYKGGLLTNKDFYVQFLAQYYVIPQNSYHMYDISVVVNLLGSSPGTALHLQCKVQRVPSNTTHKKRDKEDL